MIIVIAWRNIWRNRTRSLVIMLSVAIGLLCGIAVMALYKGMMSSRIQTVIYSETGHIQMHRKQFKDDHDPRLIMQQGVKLVQQVQSIPGVSAVAARSVTQGMISTTTGSAGVQVYGVDAQSENQVSQLDKKILQGKGFLPGKVNQAVIGKKLADKMKLKPGSRLVLTFTDTSDNIVAGAFRVAAIYESENAPLDEKNLYVLMNDLNSLLGIGDAFHEMVVLLKKNEQLPPVLQELRQMFPGLQIESWKEVSPETQLMANTIDEYSYIIVGIIMLALAFGIINTMLMAVLERTREIGMMMALGMNRLRVFTLVVTETFFLTLTGVPVGFLLGWLLTRYYNKNGLDLSGLGEEMLSSFGYSQIVYPEFPWDRIAGVLIIVSATALLSCLFPALKALRLRPVHALQR